MAEQSIKISLYDDDLREYTISDFDGIENYLEDSSSEEYDKTIHYLKENEIFDIDADREQVSEFIASPDFVTNVLIKPNYHQLFEGSFRESLGNSLRKIHDDERQFKAIYETFNSDEFTINKYSKRPERGSDIEDTDIIIMDMMMGDELDIEPTKLASYLVDFYQSKAKLPIIFLISSRDELDEEKALIRECTKLSSLAFSIMKKDEISEVSLTLLYNQMRDAQPSANLLNNLTKAFETSIENAKHEISKSIWNIDYSYIQQMHAITSNDNSPFREHLLSTFGSGLLYQLEKSAGLNSEIEFLDRHLTDNTKKFSTHSNDSEVIMHNLEASLNFTGFDTEDIRLSFDAIQDISTSEDEEIRKLLPFGLVSVKGDVTKDGKVLVHCTQQCDLSRNVIKSGVNIVFAEGSLLQRPSKQPGCVSIPVHTDMLGDGERLWLIIDGKKVVAGPLAEMVEKLKNENYKPIGIARDHVVREVRSFFFHSMSRLEEVVKIGHNRPFIAKVIEYSNDQAHKETHFGGGEMPKELLFCEFPKANGKKSYHFIEQNHVEFIDWLYRKFPETLADLEYERIDEFLKNELPDLDKKPNKLANLRFCLCSKDVDPLKYVIQQCPNLVVFEEVNET